MSITQTHKDAKEDYNRLKIGIKSLNAENEDEGFALLKSNNGSWYYVMKKLYCIIGRSPNIGDTPTANDLWEVDVDLGHLKKISKQHALIAYNFHAGSFEIKNLSKKFPIKINGEKLLHNEEMLLSSKSSITISNQEFYFLLPG